jgi:hypothetical protein
MSITRRTARPITREESTFRDDRLFVIACDDTYGPKQYFEFFRLNRVKIHVVPTIDGTSSAEHVLDRLCAIECAEGDEKWLLLDTDHYIHGAHAPGYMAALRRAQRLGIEIALSRPCFELWLLLHHVSETAIPADGDAADMLKELENKLGTFNKLRLSAAAFPDTLLMEACLRASRLDRIVDGGVIPVSASTRVYRLWRKILDVVPSHSLSPTLKELKSLPNWA